MAHRSLLTWLAVGGAATLLVAAPAVAAQLEVTIFPSPLRPGEVAQLLIEETDCADGNLPWSLHDVGDTRRVEVHLRDACAVRGSGYTLVPLGLIDTPIRRVDLVGCSFVPPGVEYCESLREMPVLPTLFSSGFDALRYVADP
ncbi:hypothetical protein [Pseudomarimonas salicorniae]|uniref:Secreted protein n=1 Tax=Pseudomarimonas salicorniae TaxID=2933270 RepID=A0ABT0GG81_9GAMM|nr:hypothetical protein [Lysobacter sp. CAU 1642]MCK7593357.1 hypothetical protein [Lysobacter sp. CAU 1642]